MMVPIRDAEEEIQSYIYERKENFMQFQRLLKNDTRNEARGLSCLFKQAVSAFRVNPTKKVSYRLQMLFPLGVLW